MKSVSKETRGKIDRLFRGGSFWSRVLASSEEQVELLNEIGFSGELVQFRRLLVCWWMQAVRFSGPPSRPRTACYKHWRPSSSPASISVSG